MLAGATTVAVGGVLQQTGVIERVLDAVVEVISMFNKMTFALKMNDFPPFRICIGV